MDETRKLLKVFGVVVTEFEVEAKKLAVLADQFSAESSADQVAGLLKDASDLCRELNTRWLEVTRHVFELQNRLQSRCANAAVRLKSEDLATEIESARMEAGE